MTNQIEQNLRQSFGFVKKDLLRLNEQIEMLHTKIQHLNLSNISLLDEIRRLESDIALLKGTKKSKSKKKR